MNEFSEGDKKANGFSEVDKQIEPLKCERHGFKS